MLFSARFQHSGLTERHLSVLYLVAAVLLIIGPYMTTASVLIGLTILAITVWVNFGRPIHRRRKLKNGFCVGFKVDDSDTWLVETWVLAHSEQHIQLRVRPLMTFEQKSVKFGFEGLPNERPLPFAFFNAFVKSGRQGLLTPDTEPTHYIDIKDCYNIDQKRPRSTDDVIALGFKIKTHAPGRFPVKLIIVTDEGDAFPTEPLFLNVTERPASIISAM